jgi:hypothetical protein
MARGKTQKKSFLVTCLNPQTFIHVVFWVKPEKYYSQLRKREETFDPYSDILSILCLFSLRARELPMLIPPYKMLLLVLI